MVTLNISMSLDGFVTGPDDNVENPLGKGSERLHQWMFDGAIAAEKAILDDWHKNTGAVIMGQHSFDVGVGP